MFHTFSINSPLEDECLFHIQIEILLAHIMFIGQPFNDNFSGQFIKKRQQTYRSIFFLVCYVIFLVYYYGVVPNLCGCWLVEIFVDEFDYSSE